VVKSYLCPTSSRNSGAHPPLPILTGVFDQEPMVAAIDSLCQTAELKPGDRFAAKRAQLDFPSPLVARRVSAERAEVRRDGYPRPSDNPSPVGRESLAEGRVREPGEWRGAGGEGYSGDPSKELAIHGVEKTDETGRLCRLVAVRKDLAVHGLESDIRHGGQVDCRYHDPHDARFDFVPANPPFNVIAMNTAMRVSARRHPESSPQDLPERQDNDKANYLWIKLFHSAHNDNGRAGFVMANSASDAREKRFSDMSTENGGALVLLDLDHPQGICPKSES